MIRMLGALLILAAGGGGGILAAAELRGRLRTVEELIRAVHFMKSEVCRRVSLPDAAAHLEGEFPALFPGGGRIREGLEERPGEALWSECVSRATLPPPAGETLRQLWSDLSRGGEPQEVFDQCIDKLKAQREELRKANGEKGRLWVGCGFAGGCLLAILLL